MLEEALEHLVKGIVDHPEDVTVDLLTNRRGKTLEIRVHPDDLGKVIGRGGRTAKALRTVPLGLLDDHLAHCVVDAARDGGPDADAKLKEASDAIARLVRS